MSTRSAEWFAQGTPGRQTERQTDGSDDISLTLRLVTCIRLWWTLHALGDLAKYDVTVESADRFLRATAYMLSARMIAIPSVCLSVRHTSDGWIIQKRLKLGSSRNFHHTVAPSF